MKEPLIEEFNILEDDERLINTSLEQCLDDFPWLLEENFSSCTAVCIVNNKLIVADNNIFKGSKQNATLDHYENVFSCLVMDTKDEDFKRLLEEILLNKFRSLFQGKAAVDIKPNILEKIVKFCLDNEHVTAENLFLSLGTMHHGKSIGSFVQIYLRFKRRFERVRHYLKTNPKSALNQALIAKTHNDYRIYYSDEQALNKKTREWLLNDGTYGYKILFTNAKGTHAELRIIDFIMVAQLISKDSFNKISRIGVSKKCCKDCTRLISCVNAVITNSLDFEQDFFRVTASHNVSFSNWNKRLPNFLLDFAQDFPTSKYEILEQYHAGKSVGFISNKSGGKKLINVEKAEQLEQKLKLGCSMWLHRDFNLVKMIRIKFTKIASLENSASDSNGPMSQSSPEKKSSKKLNDKISNTQQFDAISTPMLIKELKYRVIFQKDQLAKEALEEIRKAVSEPTDQNRKVVSKQVSGIFQGKKTTFDVFETKGDGNCGFYSLPLRDDKAAIITLMRDHKNDENLRYAVYVEIIEALRAGHLSKSLMQQYNAFEEFKQTDAQFDLEEPNLIEKARSRLTKKNPNLAYNNFKELMVYLNRLAAPSKSERKYLKKFTDFSDRKKELYSKFEDYCKSDEIYDAFIDSYADASTRLTFTTAGHSFEREDSLLDVVLNLIKPPIKVYIWEEDPINPAEIKVVYAGGNDQGDITHVYHTPGLDTHFELMAKSKKLYNSDAFFPAKKIQKTESGVRKKLLPILGKSDNSDDEKLQIEATTKKDSLKRFLNS